MRRSVIAAVAAAALATPLALVATAGSAAAAPVPPRKPVVDFNHDGYADVVVSAPFGTVDGKESAGYVSVLYGSASGLDKAHAKTVRRGADGVPAGNSSDYEFGWRTSAADLDGDSYTDLVVNGIGPSPDVVLWGSKDGLGAGGSNALPDLVGGSAGDFDGDGHVDLAVSGLPEDDDPNNDDAGMTISYGPFERSGKPARQDSIVTGQTFGPGDLIAGDMTGDGVDDLVTSHGFEEMAYKSQFWKGGETGLAHTSKPIASTLGGAIADLNGDGYGDLVARDNGTSNDDNESDKGTIRIEYGSASGPDSAHAKKITQDTAGVPGVGEEGDQFGASVSAGDVNGDGYADIAVGIPGEDLKEGTRNVSNAGSVVLLKGAKTGVTGTGSQAFTQTTEGVPGSSEKDDQFGRTTLLRDVNGDKKADLTVGVPSEDGTFADSGAAWVLRGASGGLSTTGIDSFGPKALGAPEKDAQFGYFLGN
ncbi:hypothetical protein ACQB60_12290 [Actinomycetota bacterium Odt1-20B]